jgi:DNA-binding NarL/FixJ family response regulator
LAHALIYQPDDAAWLGLQALFEGLEWSFARLSEPTPPSGSAPWAVILTQPFGDAGFADVGAQFRVAFPSAALICFTTDFRKDAWTPLFAAGADDVLLVPVNHENIVATLVRIMMRRGE